MIDVMTAIAAIVMWILFALYALIIRPDVFFEHYFPIIVWILVIAAVIWLYITCWELLNKESEKKREAIKKRKATERLKVLTKEFELSGLPPIKTVQEVTNAGYIEPCLVYSLVSKYNEGHDKFIESIANAAKEMLAERYKIFFLARCRSHNVTLYRLLQGCGYNVYQLDGKDPEREKVLAEYGADRGPCIIVASVSANEDTDDIACVITVAHKV